jgi:hypothetical protein
MRAVRPSLPALPRRSGVLYAPARRIRGGQHQPLAIEGEPAQAAVAVRVLAVLRNLPVPIGAFDDDGFGGDRAPPVCAKTAPGSRPPRTAPAS